MVFKIKKNNYNQNLEYAYGKTISALAQYLQNLQNQIIVLETKKFQMIKNQEKQENLIKDLKTKLDSFNNVNKIELLNMIRKSALLTKQFEKLVIKNKFESDI